MTFSTKLAESMRTRDSLLCVGLDPEPDRIPAALGEGVAAARAFLTRIIDATAEWTACYKPNAAFFERYGAAGADLLVEVLAAMPKDVPVILDAKRGDIGNTGQAYAEAVFDRLGADAVTVAPYMGLDSIAPFCERGFAFVLARTSNPGAADIQDLIVDGRPVYEHLVEKVAARFAADRCGFVVGATFPEEARRLRQLAPDRIFLMPGIGAQGADLAAAIDAAGDGAGGGMLIAASRSVLYASSGADFDVAAARAAKELRSAANVARAAKVRG